MFTGSKLQKDCKRHKHKHKGCNGFRQRMAYLEGISLRSSEAFRQWFKKLQWVFPGSFSRRDLKSKPTKSLQLDGNMIGDDVFPSQKNLDVIMNTLRRDLVNLLRRSETSNLITILIYKINILDNNIREICSFQNAWIKHPISSIEDLKVREKYIIRLIEEIMEDIFGAYSSIKRIMNNFSFNERNINGIISVLGILKKEVCNMVKVITASIEQRHKRTYYETICDPPDTIGSQYMNSIDNGKIKFLSIKSSFETESIDKKINNKSSQAFLPNNKSYPFIARNKERLFSSLENICYGLAVSQLKESTDFINVVRDHSLKSNSDVRELSRNFFSDDIRTDGRGDADENHNDQNGISFASIHNPAQLKFKYGDTSGISYNVNKYLGRKDVNTENLLSYDQGHARTSNIVFSTKNTDQEQDYPRSNLNEMPSRLTWPSVTVIRDIKSEMNLDAASKYDRLGSDIKGYYSSDESSKDNFTDSDSDDSYISCELDDFQLDPNFLNHVKEKYLQNELLNKEEYAERNNIRRFSCRSPKLSEIFAGQRLIRRQESRVAELYHSVESLPDLASCFEKTCEDDLSGKMNSIDATISMEDGATEYIKEIWHGNLLEKEEPFKDHRTFVDSYHTLALAEDRDDYDARYTPSMVSFASVATETVDLANKNNDISSFSSYKSLQQQRALQYTQVASPNLEDSQYSAICLALPPSSIRLINIGNDVNLLAIEVEQT